MRTHRRPRGGPYLGIDANVAIAALEIPGAVRDAGGQDDGVARAHGYFLALCLVLEGSYADKERR